MFLLCDDAEKGTHFGRENGCGKILYVPLDDRDYNYQFLAAVTDDGGWNFCSRRMEWMGFLKKAADRKKSGNGCFMQAGECDYAILSVDTLVYEILSVLRYISTA